MLITADQLSAIGLRDPKAAFAIARTLPLEGGLVDAAGDGGGLTNYGVSLRYALAEAKLHPDTVRFFDIDHDTHVTRKDIAGLTTDEAVDIYWNCWWQPGWYGLLSPDLIAWKAFDIAVNTGPNRAAIILQKALVDVGAPVAVDAEVGPVTIHTANAQPQGGVQLLAALRVEQAAFYRGLALREPTLKPFLKGWLNRAAA
jgi:type VI secretion system secreted protein VgrG